MRDLVAVTPVNSSDLVMVVHPSVPAKTLQEFIALAKAKPGQLSYSSSGPGTPYHMAGELFKAMSGTDILHVPHKGSAEARNDVMGGHVQMMFDAVTAMKGNIDAGQVRALATTGTKRSAVLPDVPTVVEGPQILPDLVPPGDQAVFLDPTPEFQRRVLERRPMPSSDPARALANRLVKDRLYADRVAALAHEHGFPVVVADGERDHAAEVESLLEIPQGEADLREVRRWQNEVAAANIRAWLASPEAPQVHDGYPFECECGRRGCDEVVQLTIEEFDAAPRVLVHR
jgi:hypothetical protein